uniref:Putative LOV domain-containing protein n=1 Tax=Lomandra longifolia TaxID=34201 RepID=A0A126WZI5_9ASPA|nr:putative LOV domain-containing protein [Lomandra longifolia]
MVALKLRAIARHKFSSAMMDPLTESLTVNYSDSIVEVLDDLADSFLITDPAIAGHPIVFASRGFLSMSGYRKDEVIGRNGRIFQGPGTDRRSVMEIREAIRGEREVQISLLNYRKDGTPHSILFHMCPVVGGEGRVLHFLAVQVPINARRLRSERSGTVFGACRGEVREELRLRFDPSFVDTDNRGLEAEELREASDLEKQKATNAAKNILSILNYYRKHTDRAFCRKRYGLPSIAPLNSSLNISLGRIKQSFVLTDPSLPDMPIVYASDAFLSLTGYSRHEVLGRNCRFLNGPGTDVAALHQIKDSIRAEQTCAVRLLNYRKDQSSFWNLLHISPVRNATGKIAFYVGVQINEISKDGLGLSPQMRQLSAVAAVKVAVRSLSAGPGPSSRPSSS